MGGEIGKAEHQKQVEQAWIGSFPHNSQKDSVSMAGCYLSHQNLEIRDSRGRLSKSKHKLLYDHHH